MILDPIIEAPAGLTETTADTLYIRLDGTSTTTAIIDFAEGISIPNGKFLEFGTVWDVKEDSNATGNFLGFNTGGTREVRFYSSGSTNLQIIGSSLANIGFKFADSDNSTRWLIQHTGQMGWGDGTASTDTNLFRSAANTLKTDDKFIADILESDVSTGTAPIIVASSTRVSNLNVTNSDQVDGADVGTSGATIPLLDGTNIASGTWTHSAEVHFNDDISLTFGGAKGTSDATIDWDSTSNLLDIAGSVFFEDNASVSGTLSISQSMTHIGDPNTAVVFDIDRYRVRVGGLTMLDFVEAGTDTMNIGNTGSIDITIGSGTGKIGLYATTPVAKQNHIVDADGTLADITTKFNTLLVVNETIGMIKTS